MKKHLFSLCLGLLAGGMVMAQSFTINGKIEGVNSGKAELQTREGGKMVAKFSTAIAEDGTFTIKGQVPEPDMYVVKINDIRSGISIFLDNSDIRLTAKSDDLMNAVVTGSATHAEYSGYSKMAREMSEKMRPLYTTYQDASKAKDEGAMKKAEAELDALDAAQMKEKVEYVKTIIKSPVAPYLLNTMIYTFEDPAEIEALIKKFDPKLKDYKYVTTLKESVDKMKITAIGVQAPEFSQNNADGKPVKLSDFRGKYVLIDFWASWCGPCRAENPNVVAAYNKYKDKNFTILGVSLDRDRNNWLKAIEDDKLTWSHVSDLKYWDNEVAKQYGIRSIPANLLLDKKGKVLARNLRGDKLHEALAKYVK